jgi:hypothetical protein
MRSWADLTGELVLRTLDAHSGLRWPELVKALGLEHVPPGTMQLWNCLHDLNAAELISVDGMQPTDFLERIFHDPATVHTAKIRTSARWHSAQMALTRSYLGAPKPNPEFSMVTNPIFGRPTKLIEQMDIFVLMPFSERLAPVFTNHLTKVAKDLKLTIYRADDFFAVNMIMSDIWNAICGAGVVVADCTGKNPNVFYELGIAHTVGKPVILITQESEDVPFDLRHIRYIKYDYTPPGMDKFEKTLTRTITETLHIYESIWA